MLTWLIFFRGFGGVTFFFIGVAFFTGATFGFAWAFFALAARAHQSQPSLFKLFVTNQE